MNGGLSFTVGSWNVRGLGDSDKCDNVHVDLLFAKPSVVGLQESKLGPVWSSKAASFLPQPLCAFDSVDSIGASGGLVSAWTPTSSPWWGPSLSTPGFLSPDAYYAIHRSTRNIVFAIHNRLISQNVIHYIT
jgi:hypothetical protein